MEPSVETGWRWIVVLAYVNLIFWTIPNQRLMVAALWVVFGSPVGIVLCVGAVLIAVAMILRRYGVSILRRLMAPTLAYGGMLWYLSQVPAETVHLAEYGILAILLQRARPGGAGASITMAGFIGVLDEVTQGATPGRVLDVRDMMINMLAAAVALWFCDAFQKERVE